MLVARTCVGGILALLVACRNDLGPEDVRPDPAAPIQTSGSAYTLVDNGLGDYEQTIPWTFTNTSPSVIFVYQCFGRLEKQQGSAWVVAYRVICPQSATSNPVPAGGSFTGRLDVIACRVPNCLPRFEVDPIPGVYRLVVGLFSSVTAQGAPIVKDSLAVELRRSNPVWLAVP